MSYDADLLNAYRDQLAKIRAAWHLFRTDTNIRSLLNWESVPYTSLHKIEALRNEIDDTSADDIENLYRSKEPPIILPDGPTRTNVDSDIAGAINDNPR